MVRLRQNTSLQLPIYTRTGQTYFHQTVASWKIKFYIAYLRVRWQSIRFPLPRPVTFNLLFGVYIHHGGFNPLVPSQNHIPSDFEIYHFRRILIQDYVPQFTPTFFSTFSGQHPVRVVLWPITPNYEMVSDGRNSDVMSPNLFPYSISWGRSLGWIYIIESVWQ